MSHKNFYIIDGVTYTKRGWLGCQLESKERGLRLGETRVILDTLFYVYMIQDGMHIPWFGLGRPEVAWAMYISDDDFDAKTAAIRAFYKKMEKM